MPEIPYIALTWLAYRLAATFAMSLPLIILVWASIRRESSMIRLMSIYWKVASIMPISMMLLVGQRPIGYLITFLAPVLMVVSIWFWADLNEELADLPPWRPLPFTVRLWRWAMTVCGILMTFIAFDTLPCITNKGLNCNTLLEVPKGLHEVTRVIFNFLFGADWTYPLAAFVGYIALLAYVVGVLQWLLIRLPKQGRIAGGF